MRIKIIHKFFFHGVVRDTIRQTRRASCLWQPAGALYVIIRVSAAAAAGTRQHSNSQAIRSCSIRTA